MENESRNQEDILSLKQSMFEFYKKNTFVKSVLNQNFEEIKKSKGVWTDNLFPPEDSSLYSGKTEFGKDYVNEVPKFLQVNIYIDKTLIILLLFRVSRKQNLYPNLV